MTAQNCLNIKKFFAVAFYKHVSHWQALNPAIEIGVCLYGNTHFFQTLSVEYWNKSTAISVIINTALGTRTHCERDRGQVKQRKLKVKSIMY